jgi:uncharacterized membrane protein YkvA (DUF1232 family)
MSEYVTYETPPGQGIIHQLASLRNTLSDPEPRRRSGSNSSSFFDGLSMRIRLILRLMRDPRINPILKLLPIGALLYLVIPEPIVGPIDDAFLLWLGTTLFVELCPQQIVQEHWAELTSVIDAEWHEVKDTELDNPDAD